MTTHPCERCGALLDEDGDAVRGEPLGPFLLRFRDTQQVLCDFSPRYPMPQWWGLDEPQRRITFISVEEARSFVKRMVAEHPNWGDPRDAVVCRAIPAREELLVDVGPAFVGGGALDCERSA